MNRFLNRFLGVLVLGVLAVCPAASTFHACAQSRPAQCLLEVKGVHYLGGPCAFTPLDRLGSFRIGNAEEVFAEVNVSGKDQGKASWSGPSGAKTSGGPLGDAFRSGACWTVDDASAEDDNDSRICAWRPDEKVFLGASPRKPDPATTVFYGSRVGMYDDIASREGLDTANARIATRPSRNGSIEFCREYSHDYSQKCVDEQLRGSPAGVIAANCVERTFSNFYGYKYKFVGASKPDAGKDANVSADCSIRELASGEILDGSTASGYDVALGIYQALCPASAPKPAP